MSKPHWVLGAPHFNLVRVLGHRGLDSLAASRTLRSLTWDSMQPTIAAQEALSRRLVAAVHRHHAAQAGFLQLGWPITVVLAILVYLGNTNQVAALHTEACDARRVVESERALVVEEILKSCRVLVATKGAFANLGALNKHGLRGRKIDMLGIDEIGAVTVF